MKNFRLLLSWTAVMAACLGLCLLPVTGSSEAGMVTGQGHIPVESLQNSGGEPSFLGELPCDGTRHDLVTPQYYGYAAGPGSGRSIGFYVDSDVTVNSFGILGDIYYESYDVVIYDSPDGHSAGTVLYSTSMVTGGTGYDWNDMPVTFTFDGGSYYVANWRPSDGGANDWANGLEYYYDSGLPHSVGPFTVLEGIEGYDADNVANFLHCNFRFCQASGQEYDFCFQISPFCDELSLRLNGQIIEGVSDDCGSGCPYLVGGMFYKISQWNVTLDMEDDACGHTFEYGIITGSGLSGSLQRYYPDGTPYEYDPTAVTLMPCQKAGAATKGSISHPLE